MINSPEFDFFKKILTDFQLSIRTLQSFDDIKLFFSGFLQPLNKTKAIVRFNNFKDFSNQYQQKIIYRIHNFRFHFLLFQIPECENPLYFSIGPYMLPEIPTLQQFSTPENTTMDIPTLVDDQQLLSIITTFIGWISHDSSKIPIKDIKIPKSSCIRSASDNFKVCLQEDPLSTILMLEDYYDNENELMKLVSQGQWHKAETYLQAIVNTKNYYRMFGGENIVYTQKIQSFALNTLFRKSAESVDVHPIHIENLYHQFVLKITKADSQKEIHFLQQEIVHKYCKLVQIHSLKGYSPIIQKVLTHITSNLSGNLSLHAQSEMLNINPSYLSALFKKETGTTLTKYVKQKRISHAVFLLRTTNMQIQSIAECCGISNVNYFTKIFKKIMGKTPKKYRDDILQ